MPKVFEHGYAVVIGVNDNNIRQLTLPAVEKDVTHLYNVLIHPDRCAYNPDNVRLIKGKDASGRNILDGLWWLAQKVQADPESTAVIYYSGHGYRDKKSEHYYLVPFDIASLARVPVDALKAEDVQAAISNVQAKRSLIILDCCHAQGLEVKDLEVAALELDSTAFPESLPAYEFNEIQETLRRYDLLDVYDALEPFEPVQPKEIPVYEEDGKDINALDEGEGRAILNSSTGIESSYVRPDQKMSVFTYHLIEALTGHAPHADDDQVVYVTDVMSWVTRNVKKTAAAMNRSQTPVMRTTGVFPVAQLIGGEGLPVSKGALAPDPLGPLPLVNTGGGDYAGRDMIKTEGGVHISGGDVQISGPVVGGNVENLVQGDQFNMSGDFRGAILNIKSTLQNVTQTIGTIPYAGEQEKVQLVDLIQKLEAIFEEAIGQGDAPAELSDDYEKMIKRIKAMVDEANDDKPDEEMIQTWGDRVKKQAEEVGKFLPAVLPLATAIVTHVLQMLP